MPGHGGAVSHIDPATATVRKNRYNSASEASWKTFMTDLAERASIYATRAHQRIDHRRKYSNQPYHVHLQAVARLVATVTDDPEMVAAAWLHDTVEDTPATLEDIEEAFGAPVAELVEELTDISKPGDGNRAVRKEIDRMHTAQASVRAKTVKLADLIDNCGDITRHDPRFARLYLAEMGQLLDVLKEGDPRLLQQAHELRETCLASLGREAKVASGEWSSRSGPDPLPGFAGPHFRRMFAEIFTARDIAEPLLSFDATNTCSEVCKALDYRQQEVASVRIHGSVEGYVRRSVLADGDCARHIRHFTVDQVVSGDSTLADVVHVLTRHDYCFVNMLGVVTGVISRDDINKPMVRMWLFGLVTMIEMMLVQLIRKYFPDDRWQQEVAEKRLEKALAFQAERQRRNQHCQLLECLQFSDKGQILLAHPQAMESLGFATKNAAKRVIKDLESLRNNLSHAQDIVTHDWAQIARMSRRMEEIARR